MRFSGTALCLISAAAFGAMGVFGKLAYENGATVGTLLPSASCSRRRCSGCSVPAWARRSLGASRPADRDSARRVRVRGTGRRVLRRALTHRRVGAGAAHLHVSGDGRRGRGGSPSRAARRAQAVGARTGLRRARAADGERGDRPPRPARDVPRTRDGHRVRRLHPLEPGHRRARAAAVARDARLHRCGVHAHRSARPRWASCVPAT